MNIPSYFVRVHGKSNAGAFSGSGFIVSSRGHIATCRHVVFPENVPATEIRVTVRGYVDDWLCEVVCQDVTNDLVVLFGQVPPSVRMPVAHLHQDWMRETTIGTKARAFGHSSANNYPEGQQYPCDISAFSASDARVGIICPVYPGDSGGPVVLDNGLVIGVIASRDKARHTQGRFVPVSFLRALLRASNISFSEDSPGQRSPSLEARFTTDESLEEDGNDDLPFSDTGTRIAPFQAIELPTYLVGRDLELEQLEEAIRLGRRKIFIRGGMPGVGKTALAAALSHRLRSTYPDGVLWARLDTADLDSILHSFLLALGVSVASLRHLKTALAKSTILRELLSARRVLVVLDNAETKDQIIPFVSAEGPSRIVITSRLPIGETLDDVFELRLKPLSSAASTKLLVHILQTKEAPELDLQAIVTELGNVPLALQLAAGLMREMNWNTVDFLDRLRKSPTLDFISPEWDEVRSSIRTAFALAYSSLKGADQRLFRVLGAFRDRAVPIELAAAASGSSFERAEQLSIRLVRRGLVEVRNQHLFVHPLVKRFCHERLRDEGEVVETDRLIGEAYRGPMANWRADTQDFDYSVLCTEHDVQNGFASAHHFLQAGEVAAASTVLAASADAAVLQGKERELVGMIDRFEQPAPWLEIYRTHYWLDSGSSEERELAYRKLEEIAVLEDAKVASAALIVAARGKFRDRSFAESLAHLQHSLTLKETLDPPDLRGQAFLLNEIGHLIMHTEGRYEEALSKHRAALAIQRDCNDRKGIPYTLRRIGSIVLRQQTLPTEALALLVEGEHIAEAAGAHHTLIAVLSEQAEALRRLKRSAEAIAQLKKAVDVSRKCDDESAQIFVLKRLALLYESLELHGHAEKAILFCSGLKATTNRVDMRDLPNIKERLQRKSNQLRNDLASAEAALAAARDASAANTRELRRRCRLLRQRLNLEPAIITEDVNRSPVPIEAVPISVPPAGFEPATPPERP